MNTLYLSNPVPDRYLSGFSRVTGIVFFIAGLSKLLISYSPSLSWVPPWLYFGASVTEIFLGGSLLFSKRIDDTVLFSTLSISVVLIVIGAVNYVLGISCGCFGAIEIPSLAIVAWNFVVCSHMVWFLASRGWSIENLRKLSTYRVVVLCSAILGVSCSLKLSQADQFFGLGASRNALKIASTSQLIGESVAGGLIPFRVVLTNHSDSAIQIVGGGSTCGCITLQNLPMSIAPGQTVSLNVELTARGDPGDYSQTVSYYLDASDQFVLTAKLEYRIVGESKGS